MRWTVAGDARWPTRVVGDRGMRRRAGGRARRTSAESKGRTWMNDNRPTVVLGIRETNGRCDHAREAKDSTPEPYAINHRPRTLHLKPLPIVIDKHRCSAHRQAKGRNDAVGPPSRPTKPPPHPPHQPLSPARLSIVHPTRASTASANRGVHP